MSKLFNINSQLDVQGTSYSSLISANTISATTFFGNINASFIGNGGMTNSKFTFLSGLTGYTQIQLNNKLSSDKPILSHSFPISGNGRVLSGVTNLTASTNSTNFTLSYSGINELLLNTIKVETSGDTNHSLNNFSPNGWETIFSGQTIIKINPTDTIKISGVNYGVSGRNLMIQNVGTNLIILENLGTASTDSNRFLFTNNKSYFLTPSSSINLIYNGFLQKWIPFSKNSTQNIDIYDTFQNGFNYQNTVFPFSSPILYLGGTTTYPQPTQYFLVNSNPSGYSSQQTAFYYSNNFGGSIKLFRGSGSTVGNRTGRIGVGTRLSNQLGISSSGTGVLVVSEFTVGKNTSPYLGPSENWAITLGVENNLLQNSYTTMTNGGVQIPNFGGCSAWLFDYNLNSNKAINLIQTTGGTITSANSSFDLFNILSGTLYTFGVFYKSQSGDTTSSCSYFWSMTSGSSENYIIENTLSVNGVVSGIPSINFYGAYNYDPQSNIDNTSGLIIKNFGYTKLNLIQ